MPRALLTMLRLVALLSATSAGSATPRRSDEACKRGLCAGKVTSGPGLLQARQLLQRDVFNEQEPDSEALLGVAAVHSLESSDGILDESDGYVVIEAEDTDMVGQWVKYDSNFDTWTQGYTGNGYIRYTGNQEGWGDANDVLTYKVRINNPGSYTLVFRGLKGPIESGKDDFANDCYIAMKGQSGNTGALNKHFLWGDAYEWRFTIMAEFCHCKPTYDLAAGVHEFQVAGRSKNFFLDRLVLYKDLTDSQAEDLSLENSNTPSPTPSPATTPAPSPGPTPSPAPTTTPVPSPVPTPTPGPMPAPVPTPSTDACPSTCSAPACNPSQYSGDSWSNGVCTGYCVDYGGQLYCLAWNLGSGVDCKQCAGVTSPVSTTTVTTTTSTTTTTTTVTTSNEDFEAVDGGAGRACRRSSVSDTSPSYYDVVALGPNAFEACKQRCRAEPACKGVEYKETGRCELWTEVIQASKAVAGYSCWRLKASVPQPRSGQFVAVGGGGDRVCRGSTATDNSPSYYNVVNLGRDSWAACKERCALDPACKGVEHSAGGRCELWTREIEAYGLFAGHSCWRFEEEA